MEEKEQCVHFEYCGAHIIQDKIREIKQMNGQEVHEKLWVERFCFGESEKCAHFEDGFAKEKEFKRFQNSPAA